MILGTAKVEDFDRFWKTFSTKGAALRKEAGSRGAQVFRDPTDSNRVWAIFDWDEDQFRQYASTPEAREVFQEGGVQGTPALAESAGETES